MTKRTYNLAPRNILQNMVIKKRVTYLKDNGYNRFIEIGSGNGNISKILLDTGFSGIGYDLSEQVCEVNKGLNNEYIKTGMHKVENTDFFHTTENNVDIIISSHVIEHLSDNMLENFFIKCNNILKEGGLSLV